MEELLQYLNSIYPLSQDLAEHLRKILKEKEIKKRQYLLKAGRICENVYFMQKGLFRCYELNKNIQVCKWFMREGDVVYEVRSFLKQIPSMVSIQALEDSHVYYISFKELQHIYRNYIEFNFNGRKLTEQYYLLSEEMGDLMRKHKPHERYKYLLDKHPELVRRVPTKYLASFTGASETTFTREKRDIRDGN